MYMTILLETILRDIMIHPSIKQNSRFRYKCASNFT